MFRSFNDELKLQKIQKSTLSPCDDKRCHESNIESTPWE